MSVLLYSQECEACVDSIGLFDCKGCMNCIGCVGLINKSYCIFNEQKNREDYNKFLQDNPINKKENLEKILTARESLRRKVPQRSFFGFRNNNVSGNHIYNAHNVHYSFDIKSGEDSKYCFTVRKAMDSYDISFTGDLSECYECLTMVNCNRVIGSHNIWESNDVYYSDNCYNCNDIFGCCGLRKKSYCIFNKQYTREEYGKILVRLTELMKKGNEWGYFFPKELSSFGYNESIANEYMPLEKIAALAQGFKWQNNIPSTSGQETINFSNLPQNPKDYSDDLIKEILACQKCGKNYKLIQREIAFYKRIGLKIPERCFNCRHEDRMKKRNPRVLWDTTCFKCDSHIKTSYKPADQKIYKLYCEKCYQQEVY
ncbi:MAG: hypothetical protein UW07_C0014G0018 [Candidatus Nomurabacteria bacterium GW2011_GWF2_43_8]|uniref:Uncharacterized protein n=1 Tax=Candidatus Nomurabacteria bacterium GW2011_GWF2_43_8 TaxID=1618779 RepID=A0A0G1HXW0_9BACT|nr:MAG: hypothetical protein UW07_C0014G0018 [Candidatus Nomurabacteria bacterium GW2011_GWF2_43_8]